MTAVQQKATNKKLPSNNWVDQVVKIHSEDFCVVPNFNCKIGSFSYKKYAGENNAWVFPFFWSCREQFQPHFFRKTSILYGCENHEVAATKVAKLILEIEKELELPFRTMVGPTSTQSVMWLKTNSWWSISSIRRSFFTAMLRAGLNYDPKKTLLDNLCSCSYFRDTRAATQLFLKGHTKTVMRTTGWHSTFYHGRCVPSKYFQGSKYLNICPVKEEVIEKVLIKVK